MQSTVGYHRDTLSTQIGPASLMDAPSVCCITDTRDHRNGSAGSSRYYRNGAFVTSGAFKVAATVDLTQHFPLLHNNLGHCKSTNRMAPPGLICYFRRIRSCTGYQEPVAGSGGPFEGEPQPSAGPRYARAEERYIQP